VYTPPAKRNAASYLPLPSNRSFAQLGLDEHTDFAFLHPVASLINRTRGLPSDLSLEARDCLTLWQSMTKYQTAEYPVDKSGSLLNPAYSYQEGGHNQLAGWPQEASNCLDGGR